MKTFDYTAGKALNRLKSIEFGTFNRVIAESTAAQYTDQQIFDLICEMPMPLMAALLSHTVGMPPNEQEKAAGEYFRALLRRGLVSESTHCSDATCLAGQVVSEFAQDAPYVPLPADLDTTGMDFFVTLPVTRRGVTSKNGLAWTEADISHLVREIAQRRPGGGAGHITPAQRSHAFELPKLRWLSSVVADDGTVWAKAFCPRYADDMRQFLSDSAKLQSRVGVSVYGTSGPSGFAGGVLEAIDVGHEARVAHPNAVAVPIIETR